MVVLISPVGICRGTNFNIDANHNIGHSESILISTFVYSWNNIQRKNTIIKTHRSFFWLDLLQPIYMPDITTFIPGITMDDKAVFCLGDHKETILLRNAIRSNITAKFNLEDDEWFCIYELVDWHAGGQIEIDVPAVGDERFLLQRNREYQVYGIPNADHDHSPDCNVTQTKLSELEWNGLAFYLQEMSAVERYVSLKQYPAGMTRNQKRAWRTKVFLAVHCFSYKTFLTVMDKSARLSCT